MPVHPDSIVTVSGREVNVFEPALESLYLEDIAWALSHQCRFAGHLKRFYSVAEHCVRMAWLAPEHLRLAALMHDASEAYLLDIPRPIKKKLVNYKEVEDRLMRAIADRFDFLWPMPEEVRELDDRMLFTEKAALAATADWGYEKPVYEHLVTEIRYHPYSSEEARRRFVSTYRTCIRGSQLAIPFPHHSDHD